MPVDDFDIFSFFIGAISGFLFTIIFNVVSIIQEKANNKNEK